jgi:hypothetical protein
MTMTIDSWVLKVLRDYAPGVFHGIGFGALHGHIIEAQSLIWR